MTIDVTLRLATEADAAFLRRLYASTRAEEMDLVPWDEEQKRSFLDMQFRAQHTDYSARFPDSEHSLVLVDGHAAGRIWVDRRPEEIRLLDVAILPEHRSAGVGGELLRSLQDEAQRAGMPLRHSVEKGNTDALRFYNRLGFAVVEDWGTYDLMEWIPPEAG